MADQEKPIEPLPSDSEPAIDNIDEKTVVPEPADDQPASAPVEAEPEGFIADIQLEHDEAGEVTGVEPDDEAAIEEAIPIIEEPAVEAGETEAVTDTMEETPATDAPTVMVAPKRKRKGRWVWILLASLLGLLLLAFGGFCNYTGTNPEQAFRIIKTFIIEKLEKHKIIKPTPPFKGMRQFNILLLGVDVAFGNEAGVRTDTIKLISVDLDKPRIAMLSIPRDTYIPIPGHGKQRINAAYQFGGKDEWNRINMSKLTVSNLLQDLTGKPVPIQYAIRVQTGGFVEMVDELGGVEIDVEKKMDYDDPSQNLHVHLLPGKQVLNGYNAMCYVRFRHDAMGDYTRMTRQDQFIRALIAKIQDPAQKDKLPRMIGPIMNNMVTDIELSDVLKLKDTIAALGMQNITSQQLPTVPQRVGEASVVVIKEPAVAAQVISEVLYGTHIRPTVTVFNGTGRNIAPEDLAKRIDLAKYNVTGFGICDTTPTSKVVAGREATVQATELAASLGIAADVGAIPPAPKLGKGQAAPPGAELVVIMGADEAIAPPAELPGVTGPAPDAPDSGRIYSYRDDLN
ncbi:MAG: LCP family protein [bacterium]